MLNNKDSQLLFHELSQHKFEEHKSAMRYLIGKEEFRLFETLKPKICRDGNQWCVLYGEDLQSGICGFGDTPMDAIGNWESQWYKKINV